MKFYKLIPEHIFFTLRFFLPPFLILVLGKVLFEILAFDFISLNQILIEHSYPADKIPVIISLNEFKARLMWLTSVMVYLFVITSFAIFAWSILKGLKSKAALFTFISIAIVVTAFESIYLINAEAADSPIASIFSFTFDALSAAKLFTENQLVNIHITLHIINFLSFLVVPLGLVAGCCIMHEIPVSGHQEPEYFLRLSKQLKNLITGGAAVMVIGIIHMQLWLNWPLSFVEEIPEIDQLQSVTMLVCQYWGVSYSLIIAALYLPAAAYLSDQAKLALLSGNDEELRKDPSSWLLDNNMIFSPIASLPQIIAVFAPMLAGSFGTTLSSFVFY